MRHRPHSCYEFFSASVIGSFRHRRVGGSAPMTPRASPAMSPMLNVVPSTARPKAPIEKIKSLTQPDPPLLAFDENGKIYELKDKKDICDYYKCKGQEANPEWGCDKV